MGTDQINELLAETDLLKIAIDQDAPIDLRENAAEELLAYDWTLETLEMLANHGPEILRGEAKARICKIQDEREWIREMYEIEKETRFPGVTGGAGRRKNE